MQPTAYIRCRARRSLRTYRPPIFPSGPSARLRILDLLRRGEAGVCHLQAALGVPQPYVSQQSRVLREAGLVSQRREGLYIYYRLADARRPL